MYLRKNCNLHFLLNQVEINNSDAEGRIVLSDAVAHATKHYADDCDLVVDMATLTGAQLISTGKMHAGILANTEELEQRAVKAGLASGDLCYPLLYAPELLKKEFNSKVRLLHTQQIFFTPSSLTSLALLIQLWIK